MIYKNSKLDKIKIIIISNSFIIIISNSSINILNSFINKKK
jgi:hypothetical protein